MISRDGCDPAIREELEAVYSLYLRLMSEAGSGEGLEGRLIYVGELDRDGSRLVRAANIAGAASLSASGDVATQKQAIREGVVDFLVTSLDEALRILKNEVRKRNAVAVCVAAAPEKVVAEMRERGVRPDLVRSIADGVGEVFAAQGAEVIEAQELGANHWLLIVAHPVSEAEQQLLDSIPESDYVGRRWLRLSPRYLGPHGRKVRSAGCDGEAADTLGRSS